LTDLLSYPIKSVFSTFWGVGIGTELEAEAKGIEGDASPVTVGGVVGVPEPWNTTDVEDVTRFGCVMMPSDTITGSYSKSRDLWCSAAGLGLQSG
jgi:hypothetical protein